MPVYVLDTITKVINSPPGQLVAGCVLGGIVWKSFEKWESVASESDKIQVWIWLAEPRTAKSIERWPETFARMFDRVFGTKHLSWKCFLRSTVASFIAMGITLLVTFAIHDRNWYVAKSIIHEGRFWFFVIILVANVIPDYFSLLETRFVLRFAQGSSALNKTAVLLLDFIITLWIALISVSLGVSTVLASTANGLVVSALLSPRVLLSAVNPLELYLSARILNEPGVAPLWFYPAFFTSIWLWLYAGSGFILKAARKFDIGFDWFSRHFDIEKKPLQSIGLVAGAIVAVVYWAVVVVHHFVG